MAEEQVDGGQPEGTTPQAKGGASGETGVQQPSLDAAKLQETLDALGEGLKEVSARVNGLQSVKDKQAQEVTGLKGKIAEYEQLVEQLGSKEGAIAQLELQEQLSNMNAKLEQLTSVSTQVPGKGVGGTVDVAKVVAEVGLDANDPDTVSFMARPFKDAQEAQLEAWKLKANKATKPDEAERLASPSTTTSSGSFDKMSSDELGAALERLAQTDFVGSTEQRVKIREELERREKK